MKTHFRKLSLPKKKPGYDDSPRCMSATNFYPLSGSDGSVLLPVHTCRKRRSFLTGSVFCCSSFFIPPLIEFRPDIYPSRTEGGGGGNLRDPPGISLFPIE